MDSNSLRAISFLQKLTDDELNAFSALLETHDYPRGTQIIEEGKPPTAFYIIREGVVHVRRQANKRSVLLATLGPGAFFGEINLFDPGVATAGIVAMKESRIASIPYERFREFMRNNPRAGFEIASALLTELAHRMRLTSIRLANSIYRPIPAPPAGGTPPPVGGG